MNAEMAKAILGTISVSHSFFCIQDPENLRSSASHYAFCLEVLTAAFLPCFA
jgi:hypothetical protein